MNIFQTGIRRTTLVLFKQGSYHCHNPVEVPTGPLECWGLRKSCLFCFILGFFQNDLRSLLCLSTFASWDVPHDVLIKWFLSHINLPLLRQWNDCSQDTCSFPPSQSSLIAVLSTICLSLLYALYFTYIDVLSPCQPAFLVPCSSFFS